jgi:hypothetical protein
MQPTGRTNKKWRKKTPMIHRSYGTKRGRDTKEVKEEIKEYENMANDIVEIKEK